MLRTKINIIQRYHESTFMYLTVMRYQLRLDDINYISNATKLVFNIILILTKLRLGFII